MGQELLPPEEVMERCLLASTVKNRAPENGVSSSPDDTGKLEQGQGSLYQVASVP